MESNGLAVPAEYIHEAAGGDPENGVEASRYFLDLPERPTAIVSYNDMLAIGALKGLQQSGVRVPEEISVTGFDNIVFSAYTNPPLTTFDQPKRFIGAEAARLLLDLLKSPDPEQQHNVRMLKGNLLVRSSTAAPTNR